VARGISSPIKSGASYKDWRRATPAENVRLGKSAKARNYVPKNVRKVGKRTKHISARQFETLRTKEEYGLASLEVATQARQHGAQNYKSAKQREAVARAGDTRFNKAVDNLVGEYMPSPRDDRKKRRGFVLRNGSKEQFFENRDKKLRGEYIPDGEWHAMMDVAKKAKDKRLPQLRLSPSPSGYTIGK
jgi:hypothetical protein